MSEDRQIATQTDRFVSQGQTRKQKVPAAGTELTALTREGTVSRD